VDKLGGDMCHHYKGETWHVCTTTHGRIQSADRPDDMADVAYLVQPDFVTCHGVR
jgi:hypothetical protein